MKGEKSCFNCVYGDFIAGTVGNFYSPPEPDMAECTNKNVDWEKLSLSEKDHEYIEEKLPSFCGCYESKIVEKCSKCETELNVPLYEIEYFGEGEEPLCSKDCYNKYYEDFDSQFK